MKMQINRMTRLASLVLLLAVALGVSAVCLSGSGDGTYYDDVGYGACGSWITAADDSVALSAPDFDPYTPGGNPNQNSLCGRRVTISGPNGVVNGTVMDRCPVCKHGDIDMRSHLFGRVGEINNGRIHVTWKFQDC